MSSSAFVVSLDLLSRGRRADLSSSQTYYAFYDVALAPLDADANMEAEIRVYTPGKTPLYQNDTIAHYIGKIHVSTDRTIIIDVLTLDAFVSISLEAIPLNFKTSLILFGPVLETRQNTQRIRERRHAGLHLSVTVHSSISVSLPNASSIISDASFQTCPGGPIQDSPLPTPTSKRSANVAGSRPVTTCWKWKWPISRSTHVLQRRPSHKSHNLPTSLAALNG